jgi:hypothetical protein
MILQGTDAKAASSILDAIKDHDLAIVILVFIGGFSWLAARWVARDVWPWLKEQGTGIVAAHRNFLEHTSEEVVHIRASQLQIQVSQNQAEQDIKIIRDQQAARSEALTVTIAALTAVVGELKGIATTIKEGKQ